MKRKLLHYFVAMLLSAVAVNSYAYKVGDAITIDGFSYSVTNASTSSPTLALKSAASSTVVDGTVTVPSTVFDGKDMTFTVTRLDNNCSFPSSATSIVLPETLTSIGYRISASSLTSLKIPSSVTSISGIAFVYLSSLQSFSMDNDGNGTYSVQDGVLYSNNGKTVFSYPRKKPIVDGEVVLPEGVEKISITAFYHRTDMVKLTVPSTMKSIQSGPNDDNWGIQGCTNLAYVEVNDDNPNMCDIDGVVFDKDATTLSFFPWAHSKNDTYVVPDGVTKIAENACRAAQFKVIDLNEVEELEANALFNCNVLEEVIIPACLEEIPEGSISGTNIQKYTVREGNPTYASDDYGVLFTADRETLLLYPSGRDPEEYTIPTGTKTIGKSAFLNSKITKVNIPDGVTTIGVSAFNGCKQLVSVSIPEGVTEIPSSCFSGCSKLTEISLPDGLTKIGAEAFYACSSFETISIPSSVTSFGDKSFQGCKKLTNMEFEEPASLTAIPYYCFYNSGFTTFTVPKSVKIIKSNYAFGSCANLEEVIIPDGSNLETLGGLVIGGSKKCTKFTFEGSCDNFKTISSGAFQSSALTSFDVPPSTKTISSNAFYNCKDLKEVTFTDNENVELSIATGAFADCGVETLSLPVQVKTVGREAFRNCTALESVSLSKATTNVDPEAFKFCSSLTEFTVDKDNTVYSSSDGVLLSKDKTILRLFPEGKANSNFTLLPPSITTIGDFSFYYCDKLENVTIPNKVTSIGKRAFGLCTNLNTVTFLCDEMIDPANIAQAVNEAAFDDEATTGADCFGNITINVRKEMLDQYQANEYYQKFKAIKPSFVDNSRTGGLNQTLATEEFIAVSDNTVDLLSVATEDVTYVLPTSVQQDGKTYTVGLVGDYLFTATGSEASQVKEVIVPGEIQYIGARAFMTDADLASRNSSVESVFFIGSTINEKLLSTIRFELTPEDLGSSAKYYDEFGTSTNIYVKESAEETYKTAWTNYADKITYKVPLPAMKSEYGTFSREFAVDLKGANPDAENPAVIAFTAGAPFYYPADNLATVRMVSINHTGDDPMGSSGDGDGTYIPANTGVMLRAYAGSTTAYDPNAEGDDKGVFYQIAEEQSDGYSGENIMATVTIRSRTIQPTEDGNKNYYLSGGKFWSFTKPRTSTIHKSYLQMPEETVPEGANLVILFDGLDDADGITETEMTDETASYVYNLQGQRVNKATKGIYIKNGKKYIKN